MRRRVAIKVMQARDDRRPRPHYKRRTVWAADAKLWHLGAERIARVGRHQMRVIMKRLGGRAALLCALGLESP